MIHQCKVLDGRGQALTRLDRQDGESFTHAKVWLPTARPVPISPQPPSPLARVAYMLSDRYLPAVTKSMYREGQRRWTGYKRE
jgi:hypothetical protein